MGGGAQVSKAKTPAFPLKISKQNGEWQASEYLCVNSFKSNICLNTDKHRCLAAESIVLAYFAFIVPV